MNAYKVIKGDLDEYKAPAGEAKFISFASGLINSGKLKDYEYMQEFRNRDSRLYASILFPFKGWYETNYGTNFIYEWIKNGNNESKDWFQLPQNVNRWKMMRIMTDKQPAIIPVSVMPKYC